MTNGMPPDTRWLESFGKVFLSMIEEEMVNTTYNFARLLRQGMERARSAQMEMMDDRGASPMQNLEKLLRDLRETTQRLDDRNQAISSLENRISRLEQAVAQGLEASQLNQSAVPEQRIIAIEESLGSIDMVAVELGNRNDTLQQLSNRLAELETRLQQESDVTALLTQQSQEFASLQERIARLELEHIRQPFYGEGIEADRT